MSVRLTLLALLVVVSASASAPAAQDGGSDLDRLSNTEGVLGEARQAPEAPAGEVGGRICNGVETGNDFPCPPDDAPPVPIDGGLSLLALAGAGYAAKRLRARRA